MCDITLYPCSVRHTRLSPKTHSFSYSYLWVGVFVRWQGTTQAEDKLVFVPGMGWYLDAQDYLYRGSDQGLGDKIAKFLQDRGVEETEFSYVYLMTAPKVLGYSFNPVSFWYLYSAERALTGLVLEVNNTFQERHAYYLKLPEEATPRPASIVNERRIPSTIATKWSKEFYVSPFNSAKGRYTISTVDPSPFASRKYPVGSRITLSSQEGQTKLVASIRSTEPGIKISTLQLHEKLRIVLSWGWLGFLTFPRILFEATSLYFARKLPVQYRPLPPMTGTGRIANDTERGLEIIFRRYIRQLVEKTTVPITVRYASSGIVGGLAAVPAERMHSPAARNVSSDEAQILDLRVRSPAFYCEFAHSRASNREEVFQLLHCSPLVWVSQQELLRVLVGKEEDNISVGAYLSRTDRFIFSVISCMRRSPSKIDPSITSKNVLSSLDSFVLVNCEFSERIKYRVLLLLSLLSHHFALGSLGLLRLECLIIFLAIAERLYSLSTSFAI